MLYTQRTDESRSGIHRDFLAKDWETRHPDTDTLDTRRRQQPSPDIGWRRHYISVSHSSVGKRTAIQVVAAADGKVRDGAANPAWSPRVAGGSWTCTAEESGAAGGTLTSPAGEVSEIKYNSN
ncbi:hypothetical protein E2C01_055108 [Portunus trituberculatus]|uniref:Uncharacterized protein n=1 Tax=Portunus trituberculatus TaxID=210409 RepID=A0A5B7GUE8_PORTR|nr:hypothetical protein [Portunus trituberculatus]